MSSEIGIESLCTRQRVASVTTAIAQLKGQQRVVLGLRYVDELTPAAIGEVMQISIDRVDEILAETLVQIRAAAA
jgi:DNA-directed RNA polymerase specialized sigma24 family protein